MRAWTGWAILLLLTGCQQGPSRLSADRDAVSPEGWQGTRFYENGVVIAEQFDAHDNDDRIDLWRTYAMGELLSEEVDRDTDGRIDLRRRFAERQLIETEEDTDFDGRMDQWAQYDNGVLIARGMDLDRDGVVDEWVKTGQGGFLARHGRSAPRRAPPRHAAEVTTPTQRNEPAVSTDTLPVRAPVSEPTDTDPKPILPESPMPVRQPYVDNQNNLPPVEGAVIDKREPRVDEPPLRPHESATPPPEIPDVRPIPVRRPWPEEEYELPPGENAQAIPKPSLSESVLEEKEVSEQDVPLPEAAPEPEQPLAEETPRPRPRKKSFFGRLRFWDRDEAEDEQESARREPPESAASNESTPTPEPRKDTAPTETPEKRRYEPIPDMPSRYGSDRSRLHHPSEGLQD